MATNRDWLDEIEEVLDDLRDRRRRIRPHVDDCDLEAEALFETCERRWRRIEKKLADAAENASKPLNRGRVKNVDALVEAIDEAYSELEDLLG
jgi:ABC-type transporter Mla subunit MlaD